MRWKRISWMTVGTLGLMAGAALASNSGIGPLDTMVNDGVLLVAGVATLGAGASFLSAFSHARGGDYGSAVSHGGMGLFCSAGAAGSATYMPALGGVAAALVHPITYHAPLALRILERFI